MKINFTSTKVMLIALLFYAAGFVCYQKAIRIFHEELGQGTMGIHANSDLNWWHYAALANICLAVGATIAAFLVRKSEN